MKEGIHKIPSFSLIMKNLFQNIETIAKNVQDDIIVMFSSGKDATTMLDLLMRKIPKERLHIVYMYFIKGLSFKNKFSDIILIVMGSSLVNIHITN